MMNCETARTTIIDALADSIDDQTVAMLDRHLAECAACSREAARIRSLWRELGELATPSPDARSTARLEQTILALSHPPARQRTARSRVTMIAASIGLLVGVASGWFAHDVIGMPGDTGTPAFAAESADGLRPFLILLHGPPSPPPGTPAAPASAVAAAVARYTAWADTLRMRGQLVIAEKLENEGGRWLGEITTSGPPQSDIGGFYLILARSYDEAEAIASAGPHIGYGGTIELRAVENTGGS